MALIALVQFLSSRPLVDAHHGDADGPGGLADGEAEVAIVGIDIAAFLGGFDDFDDGLQDAFVDVGFFEFAEELMDVRPYF